MSEHKANKWAAEGTMTHWPHECHRAGQTDSPQLAGCTSLPHKQSSPDGLAENCLHRVTSIHISPALLFRKVNISAYYSQTPSTQHASCERCIRTPDKPPTCRISHPHTLALCNQPKCSPRTRFIFHHQYGEAFYSELLCYYSRTGLTVSKLITVLIITFNMLDFIHSSSFSTLMFYSQLFRA